MSKEGRLVIGILFMILVGIWITTLWYNNYKFTVDIGGHMERASNANTIELAIEEMEDVVTNMERRELTKGYTSIAFPEPSEDVGFWYKNMNDSLKELKSISPNATQLEKSNILMKLRETLQNSGDNGGEEIVVPAGISRYPYNTLYAIWGVLSILILIFGVYFIIDWIRENTNWVD
jgi:preprotein translocase subunit SecF